jgi:hypothetical protein
MAENVGQQIADRILGETNLLRWLHAEALHRAETAEAEVERWKRAWQGADREWAKDRASRQAWAAEALGHDLDLERHYDLLHAIWLYVDWRKVTRQLTTEQKDLWADAVEAFSEILHPGDPAEADRWWRDPGFTRPVSSVHPGGWPTSTLTGLRCTHGPDSCCIECGTDEQVAWAVPLPEWQPGDPVYRDEPARGHCSNSGCGTTWTPSGADTCPECGAPAGEPIGGES